MWLDGLDWAGPGWKQVTYACDYLFEPSSSVKCGEFFNYAANQLVSQGLCIIE